MKHAGIHKIAKLARVSIGTVDRALHGRTGINERTRRNVLRIAARLAYTPHPAARALSVGRATLGIGICVPLKIHFFYDRVREGIVDEVRRVRGLGVELVERPIPSLSADDGHARRCILRYSRLHGPWSMYVAPRHLDQVLPVGASWNGTGIVARIRSPQMNRQIRATGLAFVASHLGASAARWSVSGGDTGSQNKPFTISRALRYAHLHFVPSLFVVA